MKTLNQLKYILIDFFENHAQINQVSYQNNYDFYAEPKLSYPVVNIEYLESNVSGRATTHSFKFTLADLLNDGIKGHEDEIYSDMLMVAEDFFAWAQEQEGFMFSPSANIKKFEDEGNDFTAGLRFNIQIGTIRSQNSCAIPTI